MRLLLCTLLLLCTFTLAHSQTADEKLYALARTDLKAFAQQVSKDATSELGQAQSIVQWLAINFEWKATDYQKRTVQEIIDRKGGNCNELAMVAQGAMRELNIKMRRVHEVNIHVNTPRRGVDAKEMVKQKGLSYSVFGRHHNDHVWLELYDSTANEWFPADPSSGLVGTKEWLKGRVAFGRRETLNPLTEDMIIPFAIFAADDTGKFTINRTQHYMVDEFDKFYRGKIQHWAVWKRWIAGLDLLDDKVGEAFAGKTNLHDFEAQIDSLAVVYEEMKKAAEIAGLTGPR